MGDGRAVLRHDHGHVELAGHVGPQAQNLVGHHVAAVKAFHACNVRPQVGDGRACFGA
ncbi:hypothetical protein SDC9_81030 [bioreactor metagenome]|uniref:Uncharacterized protein n=1 Tax=bioreactor metagenome TaxID=1076179 RepID=A0A644Z1F5_9ZZZZ